MTTTFDDFLIHEKVNGMAASTLKTEMSLIRQVNAYKPLDAKWTKSDINDFILSLDKKKWTIEKYKQILKKFFAWRGKPELIDQLKFKPVKTAIRREDILTVDEINKLIENTPSTLYKALIAFLFESGARVSEALAVKVKDIQETDKGIVISIPQTKTGNDYRRGLFIYSSQFIRNHLVYCALKNDDYLFTHQSGARHITNVSVFNMLKRIAKDAGITKPISAHKFRHAQATDMVLRGYQEMIIRKKLGWTDDSKMIARYQHIVDDDVINATLEKAGSEIPKQPITNLNTAEPLKLADAASMFVKMNEENAALKEKAEKQDKTIEEMQRQMEFITATLNAKKS
ncbi:Tyrosine recombinase XerA [uncultured archaeon]|nr:Tyrosine recombinase XerA [uncultured archaeon]